MTWNSIRQVWVMLVGNVRYFFMTTLEGRLDKICGGDLGLHWGFVSSNRLLGYRPKTSLWIHPKSRVPWSFKGHNLMPLVQTRVLVSLTLFWVMFWLALMINNFTMSATSWHLAFKCSLLIFWHEYVQGCYEVCAFVT